MDSFTSEKSYLDMEDNELVLLAKEGDEAAIDFLYKRYAPIVRNKTRNPLNGFIDCEDLFQEGMIAIFDAMDTFNAEIGCPFKIYALTLVEHRIINVLKTLNLKRRVPQNLIISLSQNITDEEVSPLQEFLCDEKTPNPECKYIEDENSRIICELAKEKLSKLEYNVFCLFIEKISYEEIAFKLGIDKKAVDNAVQRIRIKMLREIL